VDWLEPDDLSTSGLEAAVGEFRKDALPDPRSFFESEGLDLRGPGKWRTTRCDFHGGSDSLRINMESGGWVCMSCFEKGGNVLDYAMRRHGLDFVSAARQLGAYIDDGRPHRGPEKPAGLSLRDCLELVGFELLVFGLIVSDMSRGKTPSESDSLRLWQSVGRISFIIDGAVK